MNDNQKKKYILFSPVGTHDPIGVSKDKTKISEGSMLHIIRHYKPEIVVNLAAQAGVRYSITNPDAYIESNIIGFYNVLECCRHYPVEHLVYASSSSVYGSNKKVPYSTEDKVDNLYGKIDKLIETIGESNRNDEIKDILNYITTQITTANESILNHPDNKEEFNKLSSAQAATITALREVITGQKNIADKISSFDSNVNKIVSYIEED